VSTKPENTEQAERPTEAGGGVEDREVTCPSCFRFVGTYEKCPYCGAEVFKRISVRAFRWGSLVFAFVGLVLLWLAARGIEAPLKSVSELEPTMSMGLVRIVGTIMNEPRLHPEWGSLYVQVKDPTGEVAVNAYKEVAEPLMRQAEPRQGDTVSVQGMVRFQSGNDAPKLLVQAPQHLKVIKRAPGLEAARQLPIAQATTQMRGKPVAVPGKLVDAVEVALGASGKAFRGTLRDEPGELIVWVETNDWPRFPAALKSLLTTGNHVDVRGKVVLYTDKKTAKTIIEVVPDGRDRSSVTAAKVERGR